MKNKFKTKSLDKKAEIKKKETEKGFVQANEFGQGFLVFGSRRTLG